MFRFLLISYFFFIFVISSFADTFEVKPPTTATNMIKTEGVGFGSSERGGLDSALVAAVEKVVGVMITSEVLILNQEVIKDKITTRSVGFVQSYKILKTEREGESYKVTIEANVTVSKLKDEFKKLGIATVEVDGTSLYAGAVTGQKSVDAVIDFIKNDFLKLFPAKDELFKVEVKGLEFSKRHKDGKVAFKVEFEIKPDDKVYRKMSKDVREALVKWGIAEEIKGQKENEKSIVFVDKKGLGEFDRRYNFRVANTNRYYKVDKVEGSGFLFGEAERYYRVKKEYFEAFGELFLLGGCERFFNFYKRLVGVEVWLLDENDEVLFSGLYLETLFAHQLLSQDYYGINGKPLFYPWLESFGEGKFFFFYMLKPWERKFEYYGEINLEDLKRVKKVKVNVEPERGAKKDYSCLGKRERRKYDCIDRIGVLDPVWREVHTSGGKFGGLFDTCKDSWDYGPYIDVNLMEEKEREQDKLKEEF